MSAVLVALGAAVGAVLRHVVQQLTHVRRDAVVPWGTLAVNLAGAFVLGLLVGAWSVRAPHPDAVLLVGTGVLGAFTTYSALANETVALDAAGRRRHAVAYLAGTVTAGLALAALGLVAGRALAA